MQETRKGSGYSDIFIQKEFSEEENHYWFDFKQKKFLHNVDTFYYSVKFKNDFTYDTKDRNVRILRKFFENAYRSMEDGGNKYSSSIMIHIPGIDKPFNLKPFHFAGFYDVCLEMPDWFDIFIAPSVPHGADGGNSVTCELLVQIRSYMLWMYGLKESYMRSFEMVQKIADHFHLEIDFVQENRTDYCWHSNYLKNPEKFFAADNFYKMRVDRFRDASTHTAKVGKEGHEVDYISVGKRSQKVFIRIYLKSKEVVEKGYKPWFFKIWFYYGLINRYDLAVYEYAFEMHSWKAVDKGRLKFYAKYGSNPDYRKKCERILAGKETISPDSLRELVDKLTPKVNLVINVEFQTMRKHTKNYGLIPFFDYSDRKSEKRILDYFDNHKLITDYLTHHVFRLVEPTGDSNKSRRDYCGFWKALRSCKMDEVYLPEKEKKLVRIYSRNMNEKVVRQRAIKAAITAGIYRKGLQSDNPLQDCLDILCVMNDNDIEDAIRFKNKKVRQFNESELAEITENTSYSPNIRIINQDTGECIENYTIEYLSSQENEKGVSQL